VVVDGRQVLKRVPPVVVVVAVVAIYHRVVVVVMVNWKEISIHI